MRVILAVTAAAALTFTSTASTQVFEPSYQGPSTTELPQIPSNIDIPANADPQQLRELAKQSGYSDEQIEQAENYIKNLSPEERQGLQEKLENSQGPKTQHWVEGPGIPPSRVEPYKALEKNTLSGTAGSLPRVAWNHIPRVVSIQRNKQDSSSFWVEGNGILLTPTAILTARHVADTLAASPKDYSLFRTVYLGNSVFQNLELEFERVEHLKLSSSEPGDPDLAIVLVKKGKNTESLPTLTFKTLQPKKEVVAIGCAESQDLPAAGSGIVTTQAKQRQLGNDNLPLRRTVFGSSLRSFAGLSGSPVLDSEGSLVGVVLGGIKLYAQTGETVARVDREQDWETFNLWTWVTPVEPYAKAINLALAAKGK